MPNGDDGPWQFEDETAGATPLSDEEKDGLRPSWIATRADLNAAEAKNIATALSTRRWQSISAEDLLDDLVLRQLHKTMFGEVWKWAGDYRLSEKNIGCDPHQISMRVRDLCDDATVWVADTQLPADEVGCRFHRDLVAIHPFSNGNGRHARSATDLLVRSFGVQPFTWGRASLVEPSQTRRQYIAALRAADAGDYRPLLAFARS
jgi:Fic-DOC domain mobile mystery protein B